MGALHLYPDRVAITAGRYEATHPRVLQKRGPATAFDWKAMGNVPGVPAQRPVS